MGTLTLGAVRSCGVTTLALALAATWPPERRVLLAELDPAGGTLAGASGWPPEQSLVSLAAAARHGADPEVVWEHCQALPGGAAVLAGPAAAGQARTALGLLGPLVGRLGDLTADVLIDCGRLADGWSGPGVPAAARLILAARPQLADLHALATWLGAAPPERAHPEVVLVGHGPYRDAEIAETLGVEVLGHLPWDPRTAEALVSVPASDRAIRLAPLVRAARSLADRLAGELAGASTATERGGEREVGSVATVRRLWTAVRTAGPHTNGSSPHEVVP